MLEYLTILLIAGVINLCAEDTMAVSDLLMVPFGVALVGGGMLFLFENTWAFLLFLCLMPVAVVAFLRRRRGETVEGQISYSDMYDEIEKAMDDRYFYHDWDGKMIRKELQKAAENGQPGPGSYVPYFPNADRDEFKRACRDVAELDY